jgi:hypothetical protein
LIDCAHAGVTVNSTHPRAAAEKRLTIAGLILNQELDLKLIVWGVSRTCRAGRDALEGLAGEG